MKKSTWLFMLLVCTVPLLVISCYDYNYEPLFTTGYSAYEPILADRSSLQKVAFLPTQAVVNAGKVYTYGSYILLNEVDKGFHIIDNSNPESPVNVGFLSVLASHDAVIRNNILHCDNATDLISISITNIQQPTVVGRVENIFPELNPPDGLPVDPEYTAGNKPANTVVVAWRKK